MGSQYHLFQPHGLLLSASFLETSLGIGLLRAKGQMNTVIKAQGQSQEPVTY